MKKITFKLISIYLQHEIVSQFSKYILIGLLNTAFGYSVYAIGILAGLHHLIALIISNLLGITFNFFTTGRVVFKNASSRPIIRYVFSWVILFLINAFLLEVLSINHVNFLLAQALCLFIIVPFGFIFMKCWVFVEEI